MQRVARFFAAIIVVAALPTHAEENEFGVLHKAKGAEETFYACTACHSEKIVAQQGLTRNGWDELLQWMVEEHDMAKIEPKERKIILDYLSKHYGVDRPHFPKKR